MIKKFRSKQDSAHHTPHCLLGPDGDVQPCPTGLPSQPDVMSNVHGNGEGIHPTHVVCHQDEVPIRRDERQHLLRLATGDHHHHMKHQESSMQSRDLFESCITKLVDP